MQLQSSGSSSIRVAMNDVELVPQGLSAAWDTVTDALVSPAEMNTQTADEVSAALALLSEQGLAQCVEAWLLETLQLRLTSSIAPEFWTKFKHSERDSQERERAEALLKAFRNLLKQLEPFLAGLERLGSWQDGRCESLCGPGAQRLMERSLSIIRAILLFSPPAVLQERVLEFYSRTFSIHMSLSGAVVEQEKEAEDEGDALCSGCASDPEICWCREALEQLHELSHTLSRLQLLERVSSEAVTSILERLIEQRMEQHCRGEYERSFLSDFNNWLEQVLGWLSRVFASQVKEDGAETPKTEGTTIQPTCALLQRWHCHMHQFFCRIYVNMRIEELFSIVRDFPESVPAIKDLKFCLERTNQRAQLLASLKTAFETRLLHPGVHTSDIITVYISAIKALRVLDPSMVILQVACQPVRKYLRTREDTVHQIVSGLTGDSGGCTELAHELWRADPVTLETQESEEEASDPEDWTPDPTDALTDKAGSKQRSSDIISLLVSIYDRKEVFVNEYKSVLADRLLHRFNCNTVREIRNIELLKLRFGESHMHNCEVMLKDVADSKRINSNISEEEHRLPVEEQPKLPLWAMIISSEFWPQLKEEKMELPAVVSKTMEDYTHRFEKLKAMRTLKWMPLLGYVTLDVELEDRTISNLIVLPIHAAIILHFQDKDTWTLEELSGVLGVPQEMLRKKMALWQQQGVLREEADGRYTVQETCVSKERSDKSLMLLDCDEERDSNTATQSEQREEKLQLFWVYIQAMLTNLESMSLERIHTMLRLFVADGAGVTEIDVNELQSFLQKKVSANQLLVFSGAYRLPKPNQ